MAKGKVTYIASTNLEPIANAITYMGQSASKKDKPEVLGEKIKKISTDATAVEGNVLNGQTFYAGGTKKTGNMANREAWTGRIGVNGKIAIPAGYHNGQGYVDQSITARGSITGAVSVTGNNPMYVRMPQGAYFTNASSGYPEASVTLAQLRGAGLALQSELTAMTNDRNNWMNVANSKSEVKIGNLASGSSITITFNSSNIKKIFLFAPNTNYQGHIIFEYNYSSSSGYYYLMKYYYSYDHCYNYYVLYNGTTKSDHICFSTYYSDYLIDYTVSVSGDTVTLTLKNSGIYMMCYIMR